jgi:hypothetical protein
MRATFAAIVGVAFLLASPTFAAASNCTTSSHQTYRSSDGTEVHGPTCDVDPANGKVTADCRDGTHSYSHHRSGTCSRHGGVAAWK